MSLSESEAPRRGSRSDLDIELLSLPLEYVGWCLFNRYVYEHMAKSRELSTLRHIPNTDDVMKDLRAEGNCGKQVRTA